MVRPGLAPPSFDGEGGEVCAGVGGCRGLLVSLRRRLRVLESRLQRQSLIDVSIQESEEAGLILAIHVIEVPQTASYNPRVLA